MNSFWIQILIGAVAILHSCSCEKRLIEYAPPWQPVAIPAAAPQLISIGNFDAANKAQIAQIAHHNAQILRQIKGLHPPVTQYLNPFPVFPSANSPKHVVMTASAMPAASHSNQMNQYPTTQNLLSSSSNVAQTVMPQNVMKSYLNSKPAYSPLKFDVKPTDYSQLKFFNGIAASTPKVPSVFLNSVSSSMPSLHIFSTTSRVPILRDVTMSSPSSMFKSTQLPQPAKFNSMAFGSGSRPAASNQIPGQIISSFTHFGPAAPQILRGEPKQRIRANFLTAPFDHYHFGNPYAGHLTSGGHFVAKNNFANSLYFPHNGLGSYQLTNTFIASPQKPNSQAFVQSSQVHAPIPPPANPVINGYSKPALSPDAQPSYLPQLPTVPPSVLSPFFQVQQKQQETTTTTSAPINSLNNYESLQNSHSNTFLLNDEYTINLVPPPPYKHTDSNRFRLRQQPSPPPPPLETPASTASSLSSISGPTNSTPTGPQLAQNDNYDDEQQKAMDILNKYNIPAISPLQDANRFAYGSGQFVHTSTAVPTTSYSNEQIYQRWPPNDHGNSLSKSPSFTTEKPNIFRNLNRPNDNEYHQHKVLHPNYTGNRRPLSPPTTPFLPTMDSLNNAITHSFFTIEDAITISPHTHYRRPVRPTNTNEIEASIRRPSNDIYTESASIDPFSDYESNKDNNNEHGMDMGMDIDEISAPAPSTTTTTTRPRQKLRRKRPRPTTESTSTVDSDRNQFRPDFDEHEPSNEVITEMPKNHKEYTATRDRGQLVQFTRETTTESPRESSTNGYRSTNRIRNRTRPSTAPPYEASTAASRPKRPNYSPENRRPNNRFEDNKVQRQRPQAEKSTRIPLEENEQTTIGQRETFNRPSRRPFTTQQAIPTTLQDESDIHDFFLDTKLASRIKNSSPSSSVITTSLFTPTIDSGRPEENSVVLSTRLNGINDPLATSQPEDTTSIVVDDESATVEPPHEHTQDSVSPFSNPSSSSSTSLTSSTSTITSSSTSSELNNKESMSTSDGPVYIRDDNKHEVSSFRTRQRMRNKEKILEAVAAATSSQTKAVPKDRGENYFHHNEVNDIETEPSSTEKDSRLRVRLPVYKAGSKIHSEESQFSNVTKSIRVNGTNKFDPKNRPRFSIKEYRQRMSSTTPTPDQASSHNIVSTTASYTRLRFPTRQRVLPADLKNRTHDQTNKIDERPNIIYPEKSTAEPSSTEAGVSETTRKRFIPKDRYSSRLKTTTETIVVATADGQTVSTPTSASSVTTTKAPSPVRRVTSTRRDPLANRARTSSSTSTSTSTTDNPSDVSSTVSRLPVVRNGTVPLRRPQAPSLRQRIQNQKKKDSTTSTASTDETAALNDLAVEGSSEDKVRLSGNEVVPSTSTEENKHETAIMKIAKDDHSYRPYKEKATTEKSKIELSASMAKSENDLNDSPSEQSERVAELTIFGSNQFNSVNTGSASRRIPGYFTLATEDPILPIEAFFPQVKRNK